MALQIGSEALISKCKPPRARSSSTTGLGTTGCCSSAFRKDFTPVSTTELGALARLKPEFDKRGVKLMGPSVDLFDRHSKWAEDIRRTQGTAPNFPMVGDTDFNVSKLYDMLPAATSGDVNKRTAADNQTVRNVFVIGPDKKIKLVLVYPMSTGRNFQEILRAIDSLQLTAKHRISNSIRLEAGRRRHHLGFGERRRGQDDLSAGLEIAETLYPDRPAAEVIRGFRRSRQRGAKIARAVAHQRVLGLQRLRASRCFDTLKNLAIVTGSTEPWGTIWTTTNRYSSKRPRRSAAPQWQQRKLPRPWSRKSGRRPGRSRRG